MLFETTKSGTQDGDHRHETGQRKKRKRGRRETDIPKLLRVHWVRGEVEAALDDAGPAVQFAQEAGIVKTEAMSASQFAGARLLPHSAFLLSLSIENASAALS